MELLKEKLINDKYIIGSLNTCRQIKLGKNKRGNNIYLVRCFKKDYPEFWVSYGGSLKGEIIILFRYKGWERSIPYGEIYHVIGKKDDKNLIISLEYYYKIYYKRLNISPIKNPLENIINRRDITDWKLFSIDPVGSKDIDDCLSVHNEGEYKIIGVHIAQPIIWLEKSMIEEISKRKFSTLYSKEMKDLWGESITMLSSLRENEIRGGYSVIFKYDGILKLLDMFPSKIVNKKELNYNVDNDIDVLELLEITNSICKKELDNKELVEFWMRQCNEIVGNMFNNIPYRCQKKRLNWCVEENIRDIFNRNLEESAYYSKEERYHSSLDVYNYVHFTSPIRRIIDCIIHYMITYNEDMDIDLERINSLERKTKKFHRDIRLLEVVEKIEDNSILEGILYEIRENKWVLYFEELGFMNVKIYDKRLEIEKEEGELGERYKFRYMKKKGFLPREKFILVKI